MLVQVRLPGLTAAHVGLSPVLWYTTFACGALAVASGIGLVFDPVKSSTAFGLPIEMPGGTARGYAAATGVRNLVLGLSTLYFAHSQDRRAVAICTLAGVASAVSNGMIVLRYGSSDSKQAASYRHFIGAGLASLLAYALIA